MLVVEMLMAEVGFGSHSGSLMAFQFFCVCAICHACCNLRCPRASMLWEVRDVLRCSSLGIFTPLNVSDAMLLGPLLSVYLYLWILSVSFYFDFAFLLSLSYLSLLPTPLSFSPSLLVLVCLSKDRHVLPHVSILLSPFRMAVFPFNKLLPVSKWLVLSPLQSGTGTGCDECEEVFIMNRISLLLHRALWRHRKASRPFCSKCN